MNYRNGEHSSNATNQGFVEYMVKQHIYVCSTKNLNGKNMFTIRVTSHCLEDNLYFLNFKQSEENMYYYVYDTCVYDADILHTVLRCRLSRYLVNGYKHLYALKSEQLGYIWRSVVRRHNVTLEKSKNDGRIRCIS